MIPWFNRNVPNLKMQTQPQILVLGLREPAVTQCENALRKNRLPYAHASVRDLALSGWHGYPLVLCDAEVLMKLDEPIKEKLIQYCPILMIFTSAPHLNFKSWVSHYPGPADLFFHHSYEWWIEQKLLFWWKHQRIWSARSTSDPQHFMRGEPVDGLLVRGDFAARMSHEIRTPLSAIKGALSTLDSGCLGALNPEQSEFVAMIDRNTQRLHKLVTEFLDLARLKAHKWTMHCELGDIHIPILEAIHTFTSMATNKDIVISQKWSDPLPLLSIDNHRILQVVQNLLSNAIKYTVVGGKIEVDVEYPSTIEENHVCIWIRDSGIGIPQDHLERIFEEFAQVDGMVTRQNEGTGLGLSICKEIIEAHHGKIGVQSTVGEGSAFYFVLPVPKQSDESTPQ